MRKTFIIPKYSMRISCDGGTDMIMEFREAVPYGVFHEKLIEFIFHHIYRAYTDWHFSRTTLEWRYNEGQFKKTFETVEAMHDWYTSIV